MRAPGLLVATLAFAPFLAGAAGDPPLPPTLRETGFFALRKVAYAPQYPLWTDGAAKRRWIHLPEGTAIDASQPDRWTFPAGTRLWKEFGFGKPVETRYLERRADGSWRYATYLWNAQGTEAILAPAQGVARLPVAGAPEGRYAIPSRLDCLACHDGPEVPVLGFTALQLSADRDPNAPHADGGADSPDLRALVDRGWIRGLPASLVDAPPRIAASGPTERAALGYLHGNCGHCHNEGALAGVGFSLAQETARPALSASRAKASLVGQGSRYRAEEAAAGRRVVPGDPAASVVLQRMTSRNPMARMPPLGVQAVDTPAVRLLERWILDLDRETETPR